MNLGSLKMSEKIQKIRLGVNIDHVATLRNARGTSYPDPLRMAILLEELGVDGITAHLREDRRHILDNDLTNLANEISLPLNLEMAATEEMQSIALELAPHAVCLVPERREERTTEGGLDVVGQKDKLKSFLLPLIEKNIRVSIFVSPELKQIDAALKIGAPVVELNTGAFCDHYHDNNLDGHTSEIHKLRESAVHASELGLEVHGGHGLTFKTVKSIATLPGIRELNIGHFLISEAIFEGIPGVISKMQREIELAQKSIIGQ